jgi:2-succinyl-6-hydroxy-2,4-cyclohexadiene-1-carboxylate synthase
MNGIGMSKVDIIFLHGFLGVPSDWNGVRESLEFEFEDSDVNPTYHVLDYFNQPNLSPKNSFEKVAGEFVNVIESITTSSRKVLVGYSLGGRVALHIFEKKPELFECLVCVSTNPGFKSSDLEEIMERDSQDQYWSELFLHGDWNEVIQKWNHQDVFRDSVNEPERESGNYRRDLLAKSLLNWSLAKQTNKRGLMRRFPKNITMTVGEHDKKFLELTRGLLKEIPDIGIKIIPQASHRVLFDNPLELARVISSSILSAKKK